MPIILDVYTRLHEEKLRKDAEQIKRDYEQVGEEAGQRFDKGLTRAFKQSNSAQLAAEKSLDRVKSSIDSQIAAMEKATIAHRNWEDAQTRQTAATERLANAEKNLTALHNSQNASTKDLAAASRELERAETELERASRKVYETGFEVSRSHRATEQAARANTSATRDHAVALNEAAESHKRFHRAALDTAKSMDEQGRTSRGFGAAIDDMNDSIQKLGTNAFRTGRGLGALIVPATLKFLYETAQIVVTASQSLALLPAALTTAAAGFATFKLATSGFGQAIKDMGDVKKFSADLLNLAPNAQQAAIAIRDLMPQFDVLRRQTQDTFFAGFADKINQLSTTFMPVIQRMTTSIAQSMNEAVSGVTSDLLSQGGRSAIAATASNIQSTFQAAMPAVHSFVDSFLTLTSVGSESMPALGSSLSTVAAQLDIFLRKAAASGDLQKFINQGIDAVKELGGGLLDVGKTIYNIFGGAGKGEIEAWRNSVTTSLYSVEVLLTPINKAWQLMNTNIAKSGQTVASLTNPLSEVYNLVDTIGQLWDRIANDKIPAVEAALQRLNEERAKHGMGPVDANGNPLPLPQIPGAFGSSIFNPAGVNAPFVQDPLGALTSVHPVAGSTGGSLFFGGRKPTWGDNPSLPKPKKESQGDRLDAIIAGLDPSTWKVDPFAGMPAIGPQLGPVNPQDVLEQQRNVLIQAHDLEGSRKKRLALERDNTATAQDIDAAKWKEVEDGWKLQEAQQKLAETARGTAKDTKAGMDQLTAALDPDLGLSRGLAGLADNLVRFVGSLALAGPMAKANAISNASPSQGGYGLLGTLGAQGAFGPRFTGIDPNTGGYSGATAPSAYSSGSPGSFGQMALGGNASSATPTGGFNVPPGQGAERWRSTVAGVVDKYGPAMGITPANRQPWIDAIVSQIDIESGGNPTADNPNDTNGRGGTQHVAGLLQYLPSSYAASGGALTGLPYLDPIGQIAGALYAPRNPDGTPASLGQGGGWGPTSYTPNPALINPLGVPGPTTSGGVAAPAGPPTQRIGTNWGFGTQGYIGPTPAKGPGPTPTTVPGAGSTDSVLSLLTPGERVIPNNSPLMPLLNYLGGTAPPPGFADGGVVPKPQYGGLPPPSNPGGGGLGITPGGTLDSAIGAASAAADIFAPGAGQAVQTGVKLASRAIQYAGQVAGIGVSGLMETFLPTGGSELANNSWLTRIAGGLAGASPQLPNVAGQLTPQDVAANPLNTQHGLAAGAAPGPTVSVQYNNYGAPEDRTGYDLAKNLEAMNYTGMTGAGGSPR
jgi:hypothetical protein